VHRAGREQPKGKKLHKSKYLAGMAAAALLTGITAAAGTANAASPSCGASCIDVFSHQFGDFANPQFVMDSYKQGDSTGTPVILFRTSNADSAEDFTVDEEGLVSEFYAANLVSSAVALAYGCTTAVFTGCDGQGQSDYWAYEFMYSPYGVQTGLCTGVAATAVAGEKVTLQPCGVSGKTVWIAANPAAEPVTVSCDPATGGASCIPDKCSVSSHNKDCTPDPCTVGTPDCTADPCVVGAPSCVALPCSPGNVPGCSGTHGSSTTTGLSAVDGHSTINGTSTVDGTEAGPYAGDQQPLSSYAEPLINGSDTNFSAPYGLTYPASSYPTDSPRPQMYVTNVLGFSTGAINSNELWSADEGVLP